MRAAPPQPEALIASKTGKPTGSTARSKQAPIGGSIYRAIMISDAFAWLQYSIVVTITIINNINIITIMIICHEVGIESHQF